MPSPGEKLEEIKEALGDLPQRLAAVLADTRRESPKIPDLTMPSVPRRTPPDLPEPVKAQSSDSGSKSSPEAKETQGKASSPAPEPMKPPEWKPSPGQQRKEDAWKEIYGNPFKLFTTPVGDLMGSESPKETRQWQQQQEKADKAYWKSAEKEGGDGKQQFPEVKPIADRPSGASADSGQSGGGQGSEEIIDLLTEIRDAVKAIADRPKDHTPVAPSAKGGGSQGFKTVFQAPPPNRGGQSSKIGGSPRTGSGGSENKAAQAKQAVDMAESLGPLLAGS